MWARKRILSVVGFCGFIILTGVVVALTHRPVPSEKHTALSDKTYRLTVASNPDRQQAGNASRAEKRTYYVHPAKDILAQQKGLGGLASMPQDSGMIFWYDKEDTRCFWMKDMHFALDIIWLNSQKQVVQVAQAVSPDTYPETYCAAKARYVVELYAGEAERAGIRAGQTLSF